MTVQNKYVKRLIQINTLFTLLLCQRAHVYRTSKHHADFKCKK